MLALTIFEIIFLGGNTNPFEIAMELLLMAGYWRIFVKCGIKGWWALVPVAKYEKLGLCAGREPEGRTLAFISLLEMLLSIGTQFVSQEDSALVLFLLLLAVLGFLAHMIYFIRVTISLCDVFGRSRWWIVPWMVVDGIVSVIWGFVNKFQPRWTVEEIQSVAANYFSHARVDVLDQGLTVNLEERTAVEAFKKKYLLRDIHMYVQPGHMVLLLGGSGAGKTTFVNAVNGYEPAKAEVVLNGQNMYKNYKHMKYNIGFVPQSDLMRTSDTVYRTLMDAASLRLPQDMSKEKRKERVEEVMKIFGLLPVQNNFVGKLSGGQRKRLSIAMEFISNPTMFILDEPDSGLDGVMARELFLQLRQIADQGKIIIVITHTPDRVIDLFDDVIVLAKDAARTGRLAYYGPIDGAREFFCKESMEEIVKAVNREEEGGEGRADEFIRRYAEVQHG